MVKINANKKNAKAGTGGPVANAKQNQNKKGPNRGTGNNPQPGKPNKPQIKLEKNQDQKQANNAPKNNPAQTGNAKNDKKNKRPAGDVKIESPASKKLKIAPELQKFPGTVKQEKKEQANQKQPKQQNQQKKPKQTNEKTEQTKKSKNRWSIKSKVAEMDSKAAVLFVEEKIKNIEARSDLSKTARRKLKIFKGIRRSLLGGDLPAEESKPATAAAKLRARQKRAKARAELLGVKKEAKEEPQTKTTKQDTAKELKEIDDEEDETESGDESDDESDDDDDEVEGEEEVDDESDGDEEESDEDDEEQSDSDEDESADESDEEPQPIKPTIKKNSAPAQTAQPNTTPKGKSRYVIFVGNLPYDATKDEISQHFKKAGNIKDVRIPQSDKPKGFAYVEFDNEEAYQKGLSMHHTFIKERRINVQYTQGGKKKGQNAKAEIKAKNFKLQAMRKQGQLAGSVKENQKRSFRRGKDKKVNGS